MKTKLLQLTLEPQCALETCRPGLFLCQGELGFKTEYEDVNGPEAYCVESGEYFWGGARTLKARRKVRVTPCRPAWFGR